VPTVLLATFNLLPAGEYGGAELVSALADRGVEARWVCWDDPAVDWAAADLVAVRSTWDYHRRLSDFLDWAHAVEKETRLLNGAAVFAWNADKAYLARLDGDVPVVPTALLDDSDLVAGLTAALDRWGSVVIKPRVGAGGIGVVVASSLDDGRLEGLVAGPWIVQPLVESVRTSGETSVFVLEGRAVAQVDKSVAGDEVRVHELYGGSSRPVPLDPDRAQVAEAAVRTAAALRDADLSYARVDLIEWEGAWVVSELELIEPGLYLDVAPELAGLFADLVVDRLG
jgi:glutathione synthase/RimK-type ligase-like ATP-grasp enzyme